MPLLFAITCIQSNLFAQDSKEYSPLLGVHPKSPSFNEVIWDVKFDFNLVSATGGLGNAGAV